MPAPIGIPEIIATAIAYYGKTLIVTTIVSILTAQGIILEVATP